VSAPHGLCSPNCANGPGCWGPVLSGYAMLLMEENVIIEHNYSVSYSVITLMVFNIEHILMLNGMETRPKQNRVRAAKNLFSPPCGITGPLYSIPLSSGKTFVHPVAQLLDTHWPVCLHPIRSYLPGSPWILQILCLFPSSTISLLHYFCSFDVSPLLPEMPCGPSCTRQIRELFQGEKLTTFLPA
jgi:hypothetical protein